MARIPAFLLFLFWLIVGTTALGLTIVSLTLVTVPCLSSQANCEQLGKVIADGLLFGRVPVETVETLAQIGAILLLVLALSALFTTYQLLRFSLWGQPLAAVPFSVGFGLQFAVLAVFLYFIAGDVLNWLGWANNGCPMTVNGVALSACANAPNRTYLIGTFYNPWVQVIGTGSLILAIIVGVLSVLLGLAPLSPPRAIASGRRGRGKANQCAHCGLVATHLDKEPVSCALCQKYLRSRVQVVSLQPIPRDIPAACQVIIQPTQPNLPVRDLSVEILSNRALVYHSHAPVGRWKKGLERRGFLLTLTGPDFITRDETLTLTFTLSPNAQQNRRTDYGLSVRVHSGTWSTESLKCKLEFTSLGSFRTALAGLTMRVRKRFFQRQTTANPQPELIHPPN